MAVRTPVYWDPTLNSNSGGLRQMTSAQITEIATEAAHQYGNSPSVTLSTSSGTLLTTQTDNYRVAGADSTNVSNYVTPGATGTGSANFSLYQDVASLSAPTFSDKEAPLYWTGTQLQQFSVQDFIDTFIDPAIDQLIAASGPGTYYTSTSGSNVLFSDRVFNSGTYASSTYVTDDTTQTVTYTTQNNIYYLNQYSAGSSAGFTAPAGWDSSHDRIQPLTDSDFQTLLQEFVRYQAVQSSAGIRYSWSTSVPSDGTSNSRGATVDTQRSGTTQYNKFVNANDYRSRNFPTGSLTTTETITLYIIKTS